MQKNSKNILLIYPKHTKTFWGFENVMKILGKKAAYPPLGLLTISSMLPGHWNKKLVDVNTDNLHSSDIIWADFVFISGMIVQKESALKIIERVKQFNKPVVAGGPLFTTSSEDFLLVDHFFLGEAENTLNDFIKDVEENTLKKVYQAADFPALSSIPVPDWNLINIFRYHSMSLQYSRGCPFNCEFCDVVVLNGRIPRTKTKDQVIAELDALYKLGWHEGLFFVDDNLIGNKYKLKKEILPAIIEWQKSKKYPFTLNTQVSINLTDDEELIKLMVDAGFTTVFIGIETPDEKSLEECAKFHNQNRDLVSAVKKLQNFGLEVQGGFIVGFDSDTPAIFQKQIEFIQKSGIVTAMVGLLTALPKTKLHKRLEDNKRIIKESSANNTLFSTLNFIPKMDKKTLFSGYTRILETIYNPKDYYERIKTFLREFKPAKKSVARRGIQKFEVRALFGSIWLLGIRGRGRKYFWNLLFWVTLKYPGLFHYAISHSLAGLHLRTVFLQ
ncbi:MAG: B12-binding domain-containing radical SAM protein [Actinobacteria bacterium]|nr:B12-binding domain-containing radical SAM protein [Actinomycetota bacterium]